MPAILMDGKMVAERIRNEISEEVKNLSRIGLKPSLAVVLVGNDPASQVYVSNKEKAAKQVGIFSKTITLPAETSQDRLLEVIADLNADISIHGILVQLPLPSHINEFEVISSIDPWKDVDGFTPENMGKLLLGKPYTIPCTPAGIIEILRSYEIDLDGANFVIIGRSNIVGKPLAALVMQKSKIGNSTVTVCHSATKEIAAFARMADIIVVAIGKPFFLKADMIRRGCVVVDVGINRIENSKNPRGYNIVGDVDFDSVSQVCSYITPVPGGVGPLTVAMLLRNTLTVAKAQRCRE
ncbi:MAG: bifunctional methylenetetrahydrofolate dehydrogenase/methenyltetrahydrofolate cyclohydrolase FolD [bacterium]